MMLSCTPILSLRGSCMVLIISKRKISRDVVKFCRATPPRTDDFVLDLDLDPDMGSNA